MANYIGAATIKLGADTKQLTSDLNGAEATTKSKLGTMASYAGNIASVAAVAIGSAATTAVAEIIGKSTELYSTYEQSIGGVETLFGDAADAVIANSDKAFKTAGISANDYLEQATTFSATLIRNLDGDTQRAAELTDMAIQDMADNVNKLGTDMEMVQNAYSGLARGNATMLDNLRIGYAGTQKEALQLAKDMGVVGDEVQSFADLGFDKSIEAIHELQVQLGITGTTAKEAEETIQGSQKSLKAAIEDFTRGLSDPNADLNQLFDNLTQTAMTYGKNIWNTLKRLLPNINEAIKKIGNFIAENLPSIITDIVPILVDTIVDVANSLVSFLPQIVDALIKVVGQIVTNLAQKLPDIMSTVVTAILGIINVLLQPDNLLLFTQAFFELLLGIVRAIPQIIVAFNEAMPTLLDTLIDILTSPEYYEMLLKAAILLFMAIVEALPQILGSLIEAWKKIFGKLWEITKGLFQDFAANFGKGISNAIIGGFNKMLDFVQNTINAPIDAINGALDVINQIPGVSIQHINQLQLARIPMLASGGLVTSPTTALIGEAGPEAVIPLRNTNGWAKAIATALSEEFASDELSGGRTVNIYMTNQINNKLDINEVSQELTTLIRRTI